MELVVELHLCRGLPLRKVAEVLGVKVAMVQKLWREAQGRVAGGESAPQADADFAALREQVGMALWETVEATFLSDLMPEAGGEADAKKRPPMLGVRINALRQIATLYDVKSKAKGKADVCRAVVCATPGEIAGLVRKRLAERRGGGGV